MGRGVGGWIGGWIKRWMERRMESELMKGEWMGRWTDGLKLKDYGRVTYPHSLCKSVPFSCHHIGLANQ